MDLIPSSRRRWIDLTDPEVVESEEADRATTSPCRARWRRPRRDSRRLGGDGAATAPAMAATPGAAATNRSSILGQSEETSEC